MCEKLGQAGKKILEMGYYKNENARSGDYNPGHEDAIADVLVRFDFKKFVKDDFPKLQRKHLRQWWDGGFGNQLDLILADMPKGSFILQPGGTQSFPDLLIRDFNGRFVALEAKSGGGTSPMWNDSTPKHGAAYIMSSARTNETTMFMGEDVITIEENAVIEKYSKLFEELKQKCREEMATVNNKNRGWLYSHRRQFFQEGGGAKTNYFTHPDRAMCEKNVLDFLSK